jgi:tRNA modification GTPase
MRACRGLTRCWPGAGRGRLIREGALVTLVGAPNVGKSSLFNALLNAERAIVTPVPGTTRDLVTERVSLGGMVVSLVDTAGLRETTDEIEREGVSRSHGAIGVADLVVVVLDPSRGRSSEDDDVLARTAHRPRVVAMNKSDLPAVWSGEALVGGACVAVSARSGEGLDALISAMRATLAGGAVWTESPAISNVRHIELLEQARAALTRARSAVGSTPEEFLLADLEEAVERMQTVTGRRTSEDLLRHIFERFCIGK